MAFPTASEDRPSRSRGPSRRRTTQGGNKACDLSGNPMTRNSLAVYPKNGTLFDNLRNGYSSTQAFFQR